MDPLFDSFTIPLAMGAALTLLWLRIPRTPWVAPLARLFVPSWKFFDEPGPALSLFVRAGQQENVCEGTWSRAALRPAKSPLAMACSPTNALWWAQHALLDQLCIAMEQCECASQLHADVAYKLVCAWAREEVGPEAETFQFKVCALGGSPPTDLLISAVHRNP